MSASFDLVPGSSRPAIAVVGSLNFDLILRLPRIPALGESVLARHVTTGPGGKGANQATQAALLGADVRLVGRVGADELGRGLVASLTKAGVRVDGVATGAETGLGVVWTDGRGANWIAVAPRANADLSVADIRASEPLIAEASVMLTQLEIPVPTVERALKVAADHDAVTILNPSPAPARRLSRRLLRRVAILVPNRTEAEVLTGARIRSMASAVAAAQALRAAGPERVVITLGARGAVAVGPEGTTMVPAIPSRMVDPTGAGDAFCGALAVAVGERRPWAEALTIAAAAGALCVQREGTMAAMASRSEIAATVSGEVGQLSRPGSRGSVPVAKRSRGRS